MPARPSSHSRPTQHRSTAEMQVFLKTPCLMDKQTGFREADYIKVVDIKEGASTELGNAGLNLLGNYFAA